MIDPEKRVELGPNEVGEIISRGPQIFRGYWNQPQATRDTFIDLLPATADELVRRTGLSAAEVARRLVELELDGSAAAHEGVYRVR